MKNNNFFKTPIKSYFVSFYFFILIIIIYFFAININITEKLNTTGVLKDLAPQNYIFSEYKGYIQDTYVKTNDFIKKGDKILKLDIIDPERYKRDKNIEYLENKEINKNKLIALQSINNERFIYSNYTGFVDSFFVKKYENIKINDNILKFQNKSKYFYIESFLTPEEVYDLEKNVIVYFNLKNNDRKNKGYIQKISKSSLDNKYKVFIVILEQNQSFVEGMKVNINIIKSEQSLYSLLKF
jgi:hypothetical protein